MTLRQKQSRFAFLIARLLIFISENDYEVTFGETYRTPEQAKLNEKKGTGVRNSLHTKRLAIDLNLFKDGKYLSSTESHRLFGEWWERQHSNCRWGGRFKDGNHYEFTELVWR